VSVRPERFTFAPNQDFEKKFLLIWYPQIIHTTISSDLGFVFTMSNRLIFQPLPQPCHTPPPKHGGMKKIELLDTGTNAARISKNHPFRPNPTS
jgi:hypothetical protein